MKPWLMWWVKKEMVYRGFTARSTPGVWMMLKRPKMASVRNQSSMIGPKIPPIRPVPLF
jgi:hypothetical protein